MLMRPLNGANAELTGRVSCEAARGVMAEVSAGNYTLSRRILAGLVGERGLNHRWRGLPPPTVDLQPEIPAWAQPEPSTPAPPRLRGLGTYVHATGHTHGTPLCTPMPPVCTQHLHNLHTCVLIHYAPPIIPHPVHTHCSMDTPSWRTHIYACIEHPLCFTSTVSNPPGSFLR